MKFGISLVLLVLGFCISIHAALWDDGDPASHNWNSPFNWDLNAVPAPDETVWIVGSQSEEPDNPVIQPGDLIPSSGDLDHIVVGNSITPSGINPKLAVDGGTVNARVIVIGWDALSSVASSLAVTGGTINLNGDAGAGYGHFWLGNGSANCGPAYFTQTGGTVNTKVGVFGGPGVSYAEANLSGGEFHVLERLHMWPVGRCNIDGGMLFLEGDFYPSADCVIDLSNDGAFIIDGDVTAGIPGWESAGILTAYGGEGQLLYDYNETHSGKTTITANVLRNPHPGNGDHNVVNDITLAWESSAVDSYDLYAGFDELLVANNDPGTYVGSLPMNSLYVGALEIGRTYYWKIEAHVGTSIIAGEVWSFTPSIPSSLGRGHRIFMKRGFLTGATVFPGWHETISYGDGTNVDWNVWFDSGFNLVNTHYSPLDWLPDDPTSRPDNLSYVRWAGTDQGLSQTLTDYENGTGNTMLSEAEETSIGGIENLAAIQAYDETDLDPQTTRDAFKTAYDRWKATYPDTLVYTTQLGTSDSTSDVMGYQRYCKPDMAFMFQYPVFDYDNEQWDLWKALADYREYGRKGIGATDYAEPIPYGCYFESYRSTEGYQRVMSGSELALAQFAPVAFGFKMTVGFVYACDGGANLDAVIFDGLGDQNTNELFGVVAENNRRIKLMGDSLVRLTSTGVYEVGDLDDDDGWFWDPDNNIPSWSSGAIPNITGISVASGRGALVGEFKVLHEDLDGPMYGDQTYFMLVNGNFSSTGTPSGNATDITLTIGGGITALESINLADGSVETIPVTGGTVTVNLDGGRGKLFKFATGAPFVGFYQIDSATADSDGDGLSDAQEGLLDFDGDGLPNCYDTDSDGDGLSDTEEGFVDLDGDGWGNFLDTDADGDGLLDTEEQSLGTDPFDSDSDSDGLDDDKEGRFVLVPRFVTWPEAKLEAEQRGGHLAVVDSEAVHMELERLFGAGALDGMTQPWIGATDEEQEGVWKWVTGEPVVYTRWASYQPDNYWGGGGEPYVCYWNDGGWNDYNGKAVLPYIVEFGTALDPLNPDSDGDGLLDGDEVNIHFTSPWVADTDGDTLSDAYEVGAGLNPCDVDSDRDFLSDVDEPGLGLDPLNPDADGDGLRDGDELNITATDPLLVDSNTNGINDLVIIETIQGTNSVDRFVGHATSTWIDTPSGAVLGWVGGNSTISYALNVEHAGIHHLGFQTSYESNPEGFEPRLQVEIDGHDIGLFRANSPGSLPEYSTFTPWLVSGRHVLTLTMHGSGWGPFTFESIEIGLVDGIDANTNGISDWVEAILGQGQDSDNDGVSDAIEVAVGSDPLDTDSDDDGLADGDEQAYGTDPTEFDTDGDGVDDGTEVMQAMTDPLVANFGEQMIESSLDGSSATVLQGDWIREGSLIYSVGLNGTLEYLLNVTNAGHYAVAVDIKDRAASQLEGRFDLALYVNGVACGQVSRPAIADVVETAVFFPPYLQEGQHQLTLEWSNLDPSHMLEVLSVRLVAFDGPDIDTNGQADWLDARLANSFGVDSLTNLSPVSPVCVEGTGIFDELVVVDGAFVPVGLSNEVVVVNPSINRGWYANAKLSPTGETSLVVSHNHGTGSEMLEVVWEEVNLMAPPTNAITIRLDDSLLLSVLPEGEEDGSMMVEVEGPSGTTNIISLVDIPVSHVFEEPGQYILSGFFSTNTSVYFDDNDPVNIYGFASGHAAAGVFCAGNTVTNEDALLVNVVDYRFNGNPACTEDAWRTWTCPDISSNTVVEADSELSLQREAREGDGTIFNLFSSSLNDRYVIARLFEDGPVCDYSVVSMMAMGNTDYYRVLDEFSDGSRLIELTLKFDNLPDDAVVVVSIKTSGVTFVDGSLEKTFTAADLDGQGVLKLLMVQSDGKLADCHGVEIYQNEDLLIQK